MEQISLTDFETPRIFETVNFGNLTLAIKIKMCCNTCVILFYLLGEGGEGGYTCHTHSLQWWQMLIYLLNCLRSRKQLAWLNRRACFMFMLQQESWGDDLCIGNLSSDNRCWYICWIFYDEGANHLDEDTPLCVAGVPTCPYCARIRQKPFQRRRRQKEFPKGRQIHKVLMRSV